VASVICGSAVSPESRLGYWGTLGSELGVWGPKVSATARHFPNQIAKGRSSVDICRCIFLLIFCNVYRLSSFDCRCPCSLGAFDFVLPLVSSHKWSVVVWWGQSTRRRSLCFELRLRLHRFRAVAPTKILPTSPINSYKYYINFG